MGNGINRSVFNKPYTESAAIPEAEDRIAAKSNIVNLVKDS